MASNRKRSNQEFEDVTAVDQEKNHAAVTSVSPMKSSASGQTNY